MKEITNVSTSVLKVHPRNTEFFDDISGEEYARFKKSIQEDGILSPILVSPDMTVISGHQRLKACKDLGINLVPVMIREDLINEDDKVKTLLVANFGRLKNDPIKQAKVYKEYEKICGVRQGSAGKYSLERNNFVPKQEDIAKELGVDVRTIQNIKRLSTLSPDLQDLISDGKITATTGYKVLARLTQEEQEELVKNLDVTKKLTQNQVQEYVDKIAELNNKNAGYELKLQKVKQLESEIEELHTKLQNRPTIEKEIIPDDYEKIKKLNQGYKNDYIKLNTEYENKVAQITKLKQQIETMTKSTESEKFSKKIKDDTIFFCSKVARFIEEVGGYVWLTDHINELPDYERKSYIKAINTIGGWYETLKNNLNDNMEDK